MLPAFDKWQQQIKIQLANELESINKSHITSFFGNPGTGRTIIFSGYSNQSWEVQEDLETVSNFIKGKKLSFLDII